MTENTNIQSLKEVLNRAKSITLISHMNPDGDAIGSVLGMGITLENAGKKVGILSPNMLPQYIQWLPTSRRIIIAEHHKEEAQSMLQKSDVVLCMDFNEPKRIDFLADTLTTSQSYKVLIDHHPHPSAIFDLTFSDVNKSSTAELTYNLLEQLGMVEQIDTAAASCLFTGILTDTGCFCHSSGHPETFLTVAELLKKGVNKDKIKQNLFSNYSEKRMRLLGKVLHKNMVVDPVFFTAYTYITQQDKEEFAFENGDSEGFVNYLLDMRDVVLAVFFTEHQDKIKISFRSKGTFPTNSIANNYFNGGGHFNASGGESLLNLQETIEKFVALLPEYKLALQETYKNNTQFSV